MRHLESGVCRQLTNLLVAPLSEQPLLPLLEGGCSVLLGYFLLLKWTGLGLLFDTKLLLIVKFQQVRVAALVGLTHFLHYYIFGFLRLDFILLFKAFSGVFNFGFYCTDLCCVLILLFLSTLV